MSAPPPPPPPAWRVCSSDLRAQVPSGFQEPTPRLRVGGVLEAGHPVLLWRCHQQCPQRARRQHLLARATGKPREPTASQGDTLGGGQAATPRAFGTRGAQACPPTMYASPPPPPLNPLSPPPPPPFRIWMVVCHLAWSRPGGCVGRSPCCRPDEPRGIPHQSPQAGRARGTGAWTTALG